MNIYKNIFKIWVLLFPNDTMSTIYIGEINKQFS